MAGFLKIGFAKLALALGAVLIFAMACEETTKDTQSPHNSQNLNQQTNKPGGGILFTPDEYGSEQARKLGYTVIHQDTATSASDERCGIGGGRYSKNGKTLCTIFNQKNDWYSASDAHARNCPNGFVRVDQAGINRESLPGSTRQCRTVNKQKISNERAHYYCPHGSNLVGVRTGTLIGRYGPCQMKCDPDTRHLYKSECNSPKNKAQPTNSQSPNDKKSPTQPKPPTTTPTTQRPATPVNTPRDIALPDTPKAGSPDESLIPPLPALELITAPDNQGIHIVGIETWFWIYPDEWQAIESSHTQNEHTYTISGEPVSLQIVITGPHNTKIKCGNGSGRTLENEGDNLCSYSWKNAGSYSIQSEIKWAISWTCSPNCGSGVFPARTILSDKIPISVSEAQALIIPANPSD